MLYTSTRLTNMLILRSSIFKINILISNIISQYTKTFFHESLFILYELVNNKYNNYYKELNVL